MCEIGIGSWMLIVGLVFVATVAEYFFKRWGPVRRYVSRTEAHWAAVRLSKAEAGRHGRESAPLEKKG